MYPAESAGGAVSAACFRAFMTKLGYDPDDLSDTGESPRALGNRVGRLVIDQFRSDGANEANNYADTSWKALNPPLIVDEPGTTCTEPSRYQPLNLASAANPMKTRTAVPRENQGSDTRKHRAESIRHGKKK